MLFKGTFEHTIDAKGRMFVPAKFRDALGDDFVIFKWMDEKCLYVMSLETFGNFSASVGQTKLSTEEAAKIQRKLYSSACDADLDAQKRVLIPADLRKATGLDKDVLVVGVRNHVELWNPDTWRAAMGDDMDEAGGAADELRGLIYKL